MAFVLSGTEFTDERVSFANWTAIKPTTKFGQLPLLSIDGAEPIAQSGAMLRFVGKLGDQSLYPNDVAAMMEVEELLGLAGDFDRAWTPAIYMNIRPEAYGYPAGYNALPEGKETIQRIRVEFVATKLPEFMEYYSRALEKNGNQFLCGPNPTIADCYVLPQLRRLQSGEVDFVSSACLDGYPIIIAWIARMLALPAVDKWYNSPK